MKILGIHSSHDSGAAIIEDGKILAAINEERLKRIKIYRGTPKESIPAVFEIAKVTPSEIDFVAIASITPPSGGREGPHRGYDEVNTQKKILQTICGIAPAVVSTDFFAHIPRFILSKLRKAKKELAILKRLGVKAPVYFVDHHASHAASAMYTSPFDKDTIIFTMDDIGDFLSASTSIVENDYSLKTIDQTSFYHSFARIYAYVTHNLGFMASKHEGKITGLAAFGKAEKTYPVFESIMQTRGIKPRIRKLNSWGLPSTKRLHIMLQHKKWDDIAAGLQKRLEDVYTELVVNTLKKHPRSNIALAGGLFANVKLNQRIAEINGVNKIYIHPNMGDGGLAVGAAMQLWVEKMLDAGKKPKPVTIDSVYFGPSFSEEQIEKELKNVQLKYTYHDEIEQEIAQLVNDKKIVGRFNGRMEYGPRALGNRSILADPRDKTINDWLNKRLKRTEFMPFAPSLMKESAPHIYKNFSSGEIAAQFMTITFDVKEEEIKRAPAVTHIDGTARPQTVTKQQNESYYKILKIYHELSGLPIFVNTSFNMHEEPIVCAPSDAIRSLKNGSVDYLAIGNFLVKHKD